jgi:4-hydroxy-tetrahydrodipicolinate reductase
VKMKIALFGAGRTGGRVAELATVVGPFTRARAASVDELRQAEAVVLFVPGAAVPALLPLLLEAGKPVISGATGYTFTEADKAAISARGLPWVQASNFSLGMNLMLELARRVGSYAPARELGSFAMSETHHVHKLDAPSGSALSLQRAVGRKLPIESIREGDVVGLHTLTLALPGESISLTHNAEDRRVFAEGALWAARLVRDRQLAGGFYWFEDLVRQYCFNEGARS